MKQFSVTSPYADRRSFLRNAGCGFGALALAAEPEFPVKPKEVRKIFADGKRNAFTAFVNFKDQYLIAFRTAKEHNSTDGDIVVLKSTDAKEWTEALRLDIDKRDDRDPRSPPLPSTGYSKSCESVWVGSRRLSDWLSHGLVPRAAALGSFHEDFTTRQRPLEL